MNVRAFVAIDLSASVRDTLLDLSLVFRDQAPEWAADKWVAPQNLHITVKFIGTITETGLPEVHRALKAAATRAEPFRLEVTSIKAVPNERRATMLWGVFGDGAEESARLARAVDRALEPFEIPPETRRFVPHVTLVRARRPRPVRAEAVELVTGALAISRASGGAGFVSVDSITLYSSTLGPTGPTYEALARIPLGG